jgi:hypothetical protein
MIYVTDDGAPSFPKQKALTEVNVSEGIMVSGVITATSSDRLTN